MDDNPHGNGTMTGQTGATPPRNSCTINKQEKNGLGRAYIAGFKWALERKYEIVFEMDCDFSHDPVEIPNFLKAARSAVILVAGLPLFSGSVRV